jgi:hypothetical protein
MYRYTSWRNKLVELSRDIVDNHPMLIAIFVISVHYDGSLQSIVVLFLEIVE